jgi:hypothetical protein
MTDEQSTTPVPPVVEKTMSLHRIVQIALLTALMWKWQYFLDADQVYQEIPLADSFFPAWLQSFWTLRAAFLATVGSILISLVAGSRLRIACGLTTLVGASILCLHQGSYNDMTFVTAWWTALWNAWFVFRMDDDDQQTVLRRAAFLSRLIISMIMLGGAVGKWTAEYWSGEVFWDIYFRDRDFWVFNLLRHHYEPETLREIAMWYSRKVIVVETLAGFGLWLLPAKWAAAIAIFVLMSIALLSNFYLFSVLLSLAGLATAGFFVMPQKR